MGTAATGGADGCGCGCGKSEDDAKSDGCIELDADCWLGFKEELTPAGSAAFGYKELVADCWLEDTELTAGFDKAGRC
jgi:hypothetical protein